MMKWILAVAATLTFAASASAADKVVADAELVRLWRARAVLVRQGQGIYAAENIDLGNPGRPRVGGDHASGGGQEPPTSAMSTSPP